MRLLPVERVLLGAAGVRGNRRFFWIDDRDRMVNAKTVGELQPVMASYDDDSRSLEFSFPDGRVVSDSVVAGDQVEPRFYSRMLAGRLVEGPWSEAVSAFLGRRLRLVEAVGDAGAVDRGAAGAASLISQASLAQLASVGGYGTDGVDVRRFRMLIEVDGVAAHAEDTWVGRSVRIGDAVLAFGGHVGRCLITSRHPETGEVDVPTLELLERYRKGVPAATEPLPFGIYGRVLEPGVIRVGDAVVIDPA
jgi:hypothetical protein